MRRLGLTPSNGKLLVLFQTGYWLFHPLLKADTNLEQAWKRHAELGYFALTTGLDVRLPGNIKRDDWDHWHTLVLTDEMARVVSCERIFRISVLTPLVMNPTVSKDINNDSRWSSLPIMAVDCALEGNSHSLTTNRERKHASFTSINHLTHVRVTTA